MRKAAYLALTLIAMAFSANTYAQTEKGNTLVGATLGNIGGVFANGTNTFKLNLSPKAGWFIKDNVALGAMVNLGLTAGSGTSTFDYGVGAFGRYYISDKKMDLSKRSRWFLEANAGISGVNKSIKGGSSSNTNGLGLGFGPGLAYFLTPTIGLEAMLKYDLTLGFGSSVASHAIGVGVGFQIYLPSSKARQILREEKAEQRKK